MHIRRGHPLVLSGALALAVGLTGCGGSDRPATRPAPDADFARRATAVCGDLVRRVAAGSNPGLLLGDAHPRSERAGLRVIARRRQAFATAAERMRALKASTAAARDYVEAFAGEIEGDVLPFFDVVREGVRRHDRAAIRRADAILRHIDFSRANALGARVHVRCALMRSS